MLKKFTTLHLTLKGGLCSVSISHQPDRELPNSKVPVFITQSLLRGKISAEGISKADPAEGGWLDSAHTFFVRGNFVTRPHRGFSRLQLVRHVHGEEMERKVPRDRM